MWIPVALALLVVPGAALAASLGSGAGRSPLARAHLAVLLSVAWLSVTGIVLGQLGRFGLAGVCAAAVLPVVVMAALGRRRRRSDMAASGGRTQRARPPTHELVGVAVVAAILVHGYWPPFEDVLGGRDPGVYLASGHTLARTGRLRFVDPLVRELAPAERAIFFGAPGNPAEGRVGARFAGFYLEDLERGLVAPQFMPLDATWIGLAHLLGGRAAVAVVPLLFVALALVGMLRVGDELGDPWAGVGAAALLGVGALENWFGRGHLSEIPFQALVLGGVATGIAWTRRGGRAEIAAAVAATTLLGVTRIDAVLVVPPLLAALAGHALLVPGRRGERTGLVLALGLGAWVAATWATTSRIYVLQVFGRGLPDRLSDPRLLAAAGVVAVGVAVALVTRARWSAPARRLAATVLVVMPWAAALLAVGGLWAWLARPELARGTQALSVFKLELYLGPWLLATGLAGLVWLVALPAGTGRALLVGAVLPMTVVYVHHPHIRIDQLWEMRRFVSVTVPGLVLGACLVAGQVARLEVRRLPLGALVVIAWAALVTRDVLAPARGLDVHVEGRGSAGWLADVCAALPEDALVVADSRYRSSAAAQLTAPVAYLCERDVLELGGFQVEDERLASVLERYHAAGRPLRLLSSGTLPLFTDRFHAVLERRVDGTVSRLETTFFRPPEAVVDEVVSVAIFDVRPGPPAPRTALEMGVEDAPLLDGFYAAEPGPEPGSEVRWTRRVARARLPGLGAADALFVRMSTQRPAGAPASLVALQLGDRAPVELRVDNRFRIHRVPLDRSVTGEDELVLEVRRGAERIGRADARELGVSVDWIFWGGADAIEPGRPEHGRFLEGGWHGPEVDRAGRPFRWTERQASVYLPRAPAPGATPACVRVLLDGDRPGDPGGARVRFRVHGAASADLRPRGGLEAIDVPIPGDLFPAGGLGPLPRFDVLSSTVGVAGDGGRERRLGVRVYRIEALPGDACRSRLAGFPRTLARP